MGNRMKISPMRELRRELFSKLVSEISRQLKKKRVTEREIQEDFEHWRKAKRATRHRH